MGIILDYWDRSEAASRSRMFDMHSHNAARNRDMRMMRGAAKRGVAFTHVGVVQEEDPGERMDEIGCPPAVCARFRKQTEIANIQSG